jgi:hypothetical protein
MEGRKEALLLWLQATTGA